MVYSSKRQAFLVSQGYAFKVITHLGNLYSVPNLALNSAHARKELLQNILADMETKHWKEEEERENAGLVADGNMFYGSDGSRCAEQE